jgi:hypothetical protein
MRFLVSFDFELLVMLVRWSASCHPLQKPLQRKNKQNPNPTLAYDVSGRHAFFVVDVGCIFLPSGLQQVSHAVLGF